MVLHHLPGELEFSVAHGAHLTLPLAEPPTQPSAEGLRPSQGPRSPASWVRVWPPEVSQWAAINSTLPSANCAVHCDRSDAGALLASCQPTGEGRALRESAAGCGWSRHRRGDCGTDWTCTQGRMLWAEPVQAAPPQSQARRQQQMCKTFNCCRNLKTKACCHSGERVLQRTALGRAAMSESPPVRQGPGPVSVRPRLSPAA